MGELLRKRHMCEVAEGSEKIEIVRHRDQADSDGSEEEYCFGEHGD